MKSVTVSVSFKNVTLSSDKTNVCTSKTIMNKKDPFT